MFKIKVKFCVRLRVRATVCLKRLMRAFIARLQLSNYKHCGHLQPYILYQCEMVAEYLCETGEMRTKTMHIYEMGVR